MQEAILSDVSTVSLLETRGPDQPKKRHKSENNGPSAMGNDLRREASGRDSSSSCRSTIPEGDQHPGQEGSSILRFHNEQGSSLQHSGNGVRERNHSLPDKDRQKPFDSRQSTLLQHHFRNFRSLTKRDGKGEEQNKDEDD